MTKFSVSYKRLNGTSGPCETFGNLCLAHAQEFELKNVEVNSDSEKKYVLELTMKTGYVCLFSDTVPMPAFLLLMFVLSGLMQLWGFAHASQYVS